MESSLETLNRKEKKYTAELDAALAQYAELQQQAADMDAIELDKNYTKRIEQYFRRSTSDYQKYS